MGTLSLILPEIVLLAGAVAALFADLVGVLRGRGAAWVGAVAAAGAAVAGVVVGRGGVELFGGALVIDAAAQAARVATAGLTAVFLVWLAGAGLKRGSVKEFTSLALFATMGALLMCAARDWVVLLLALETATMPAYVLLGFDRTDDRSLEGALKYFLLSMVSTVTMLYGLSFIIGMSGTTAIAKATLQPGPIGLVAVVFLLAGLLAKLSAAPFQWWSPDAYAGAPAAAVAFVSAVPKIAGLAVFATVVRQLAPQQPLLMLLLVFAAVLSMLVGNLGAYPQQDVRRLMAYSGIAHAGYLLVGLAASARTLAPVLGTGDAGTGLGAALFYAIAYAVPSMGVMLIAAEQGDRLDDLKGLVRRRPWAAWSMLVLLISLVGVPPLAGFTGKLYLFGSAVGAGLTPLAVVAVLMSVVSAGFYFRIVRAMFFDEPVVTGEPGGAPASVVAVVVCVALTVAIGVAASPLMSAIGLSFR